ncbi:uncharacterized protein LOC116108970 [Pistacia vera]|uniref:uncharacterized protein LOC116108970 n=1 Tax=Pistacia vera TaxID=55513 RepID=UPI0012639E3A|nr:uncharacterized protein LOC116108970 [Pistacia vera]
MLPVLNDAEQQQVDVRGLQREAVRSEGVCAGIHGQGSSGFVQSFKLSRSREQEQGGVGGGFEAEIEEEIPNKKPKLNKYHTTTGGEGDDELQKTFFNSQVGDEETREHEKARASATSKWSSYLTQDDTEPTTCQATMSMAASKWSNYMTQNDMETVTCQPKNTNMTKNDIEPKTCQARKATAASKCRDYMTQNDMEPGMTKAAPRARQTKMAKAASKWGEGDKKQRPHLPKEGKAASKWDNYLTHEEDELQGLNGRKIADQIGNWSNGVFETTTNDQRVEDDIHPDFI